MKLYENKKVVKNDVEFYVFHNSILVTRKMPTGARFLQMASLYSLKHYATIYYYFLFLSVIARIIRG